MDKEAIKLLKDIKKLIILQLRKGGSVASPKEIGDVLGVTERSVQNVITTSKKPRKKKTR